MGNKVKGMQCRLAFFSVSLSELHACIHTLKGEEEECRSQECYHLHLQVWCDSRHLVSSYL